MEEGKSFDCVEMKRRIQRSIAERYAGVPEEEARRQQEAEIAANPLLAPFLGRARAEEPARTSGR